jgi:hypothetical protein
MTIDAYSMDRDQLVEHGHTLATAFLVANGIKPPKFDFGSTLAIITVSRSGGSCGLYSHERDYRGRRRMIVSVVPSLCAKPAPGVALAWSFPTYKTDRTPVGVVAHEIGHHVDFMLGVMEHGGRADWRAMSRDRVSSYEPCPEEAFAETMRLFILNPHLLEAVAPTRYAYLRHVLGLVPTERRDAVSVLRSWNARSSYIEATAKKFN